MWVFPVPDSQCGTVCLDNHTGKEKQNFKGLLNVILLKHSKSVLQKTCKYNIISWNLKQLAYFTLFTTTITTTIIIIAKPENYIYFEVWSFNC